MHPCLLTNFIARLSPQFYRDDLEDELNIVALRLLVKDLLILFQAGNEGVINVLGMSFCFQPPSFMLKSAH
jgi:hypothetical protein